MRALLLLTLSTLVLVSPPVAGQTQADRLTDKQVKVLLDDIEVELNEFEKAIDPPVRKSILRSQIGETDVQAFFKDLRQNRNKARKRLGSGYSSSTEVGAFLTQASVFEVRADEGWSLYGAEGAWLSLRPLLVRLAAAYGIEWGSDSGTWRPRRKSDGEIQEVLDELVTDVTSFRKAFRSDVKSDKSLPRTDRKALMDRAYDLEVKAQDLADGFRKSQTLETGVSRLEASIVQLEEAVAERPVGARAEIAWAQVLEGLAWLRDEFDLPEIRQPALSSAAT